MSFLSWLASNKDAVDLCIKGLGLVVTVVGGIYVGVKFFSDRLEARRQKELDLKREAFFDLFTAITQLNSELGRNTSLQNEFSRVVPLWHQAVCRLHLLADQETLKCISERNALFHEGMFELMRLKKAALVSDETFDRVQGGQGASQTAVSLAESGRVTAWELLWDTSKTVVIKLAKNYRELMVLARKEIGLDANIGPVIEALEAEEKRGLAAFQGILVDLRRIHGLPSRP